MRYRKPEELKESGIEWIGKIPNNWSLTKIKRGYKVQLGKMLQSEPKKENETKERYLRAANITWKSVDYSDIKKMWFSPEEKEKYNLKDYDLLVTEGGDVGRSTIFINNDSGKYFYQNALNRVRGRNNNKTAFLYYCIYTLKHCGYIDLICGKSTIAHLTAEKLERLPIYLPTKSEQRSIAAFLDRKTEAIDQLIEKKEQLIARLTEKRQALITRAVTKGLDPDPDGSGQAVPMKDSGIEWLGEKPKHWKTTRLRFLANINTGSKNTEDTEENGEYPFYVRSPIIRSIDEYSYDEEAVLTSGDGAGVCEIYHYVNGKYELHQRMYRITDFKEILGKYLYYYMIANFKKDVMKFSAKSTVDSLRMHMFKNFPVVYGAIKEQKEIVNYIEEQEKRFESIISCLETQINKLKEYRQALISAAVTGKIDVRSTYAEASGDRDEVEAV